MRIVFNNDQSLYLYAHYPYNVSNNHWLLLALSETHNISALYKNRGIFWEVGLHYMVTDNIIRNRKPYKIEFKVDRLPTIEEFLRIFNGNAKSVANNTDWKMMYDFTNHRQLDPKIKRARQ